MSEDRIFRQVSPLRNILIFPHRGDPPPEQPPYVRDPGDPYVFYLPWAECRHRRDPQGKCCGDKIEDGRDQAIVNNSQWCILIDEPVDRLKCHVCKLPEKGK